jgi:hypothetical protein
MKVNIQGRGMIPLLGVLAPVRNIQISFDEISNLLNYRQFSIYQASTGLAISRRNLCALWNESSCAGCTDVPPVVAPTPPVITTPPGAVEPTLSKPPVPVVPTAEVVPVGEIVEDVVDTDSILGTLETDYVCETIDEPVEEIEEDEIIELTGVDSLDELIAAECESIDNEVNTQDEKEFGGNRNNNNGGNNNNQNRKKKNRNNLKN